MKNYNELNEEDRHGKYEVDILEEHYYNDIDKRPISKELLIFTGICIITIIILLIYLLLLLRGIYNG